MKLGFCGVMAFADISFFRFSDYHVNSLKLIYLEVCWENMINHVFPSYMKKSIIK